MSVSELAAKYRLPEDQAHQLKRVFDQFDLDKDGVLTATEIEQALKNMGHGVNKEMVAKMVAFSDSNKDGKINFEEFITVAGPKIKAKSKKSSLEAAFKEFDQDKDGFITAAELKAAWDKMGEPLTLVEANNMIAQADEDGDGQVSYQEFATLWKSI